MNLQANVELLHLIRRDLHILLRERLEPCRLGLQRVSSRRKRFEFIDAIVAASCVIGGAARIRQMDRSVRDHCARGIGHDSR